MTDEINNIEDSDPKEDLFNIEYGTPGEEDQSFSEVVKIWFKFPKYTKELFLSQIKKASISHTLWGLIILSVLVILLDNLYPIVECAHIPEQAESYFCPHDIYPSRVIFPFIKIIFNFYFWQLCLIVFYKIFRGKGNYSTQAYISMLYFIPLNLLIQLALFLQLIPVVGRYITLSFVLVLLISGYIFQIRSLQVVHKFSRTKSILLISIPIVLYLLLLFIQIDMAPEMLALL